MNLFGSSSELSDPDKPPLNSEEEEVLEKLAKKTIQRGMAVPAILFLESVKPLNFIGSQVMVFFEPVIQSVFNFRDYDTVRGALEKRQTIEILLLKIEKYDAIAHAREKRIRKFLKQEKKKWKWYQRYLGIFTPRVEYPEEIVNPPVPENKDSTDTPSS